MISKKKPITKKVDAQHQKQLTGEIVLDYSLSANGDYKLMGMLFAIHHITIRHYKFILRAVLIKSIVSIIITVPLA